MPISSQCKRAAQNACISVAARCGIELQANKAHVMHQSGHVVIQ